jgi:hypothetical protein
MHERSQKEESSANPEEAAREAAFVAATIPA